MGIADLAKLASALAEGEDNLIERLILKKFEDIGEDAIMQLIGGPLGTVARIGKAIETGGGSEYDRLRGEWLKKAVLPQGRLSGLPGKIQAKLQEALYKTDRDRDRRWSTKWGRSGWAKSRQEWLDNSWRHDWRSQPRSPETGRWVPGRLEYISADLMYSGRKIGRTVRTFCKKRRARRAAAKKLARRIMEGDN